MAIKSRPTMMKRARERARAEKRKEKTARRLERAQQDTPRSGAPAGVDPDIAHIQPGPQPLADWQVEETETETEEKDDESVSG